MNCIYVSESVHSVHLLFKVITLVVVKALPKKIHRLKRGNIFLLGRRSNALYLAKENRNFYSRS